MGIIDDDKAVNQALEEVEELRAALAAMTDRADAESLRAERAEETALKLKPMYDDYGTLIADNKRMVAKLEAVEHEVALLIPNDLWFGSIDDLRRFVIRQMQAALATTSPSLRQRVEKWIVKARANKYLLQTACHDCAEQTIQGIEAALKGEACPK